MSQQRQEKIKRISRSILNPLCVKTKVPLVVNSIVGRPLSGVLCKRNPIKLPSRFFPWKMFPPLPLPSGFSTTNQREKDGVPDFSTPLVLGRCLPDTYLSGSVLDSGPRYLRRSGYTVVSGDVGQRGVVWVTDWLSYDLTFPWTTTPGQVHRKVPVSFYSPSHPSLEPLVYFLKVVSTILLYTEEYS